MKYFEEFCYALLYGEVVENPVFSLYAIGFPQFSERNGARRLCEERKCSYFILEVVKNVKILH